MANIEERTGSPGFLCNAEARLDVEDFNRQTLRIEGGIPLTGEILDVRGGKNITYALAVAACLANSPSILHNVSQISEVSNVVNIIEALGGQVEISENGSTMAIDPTNICSSVIPMETGEVSRVSTLVGGFLLGKFGRAEIPLPGGDPLGERPIDIYIDGLRSMGADVDDSQSGKLILSAPNGLKGSEYTLHLPSHTGTEALILAAVQAEGETILHGTALEQEVDELI